MLLKKGKSKIKKTYEEKEGFSGLDDRKFFKIFDKYMRAVRQHNKKVRLEERKKLRKLKRGEP